MMFLPPSVFHPPSATYMSSANCIARDFYTEQYARFCATIRRPARLHRKLWEFAFIAEHLERAGALKTRNRGVGFGVGTEPLPALFASMGCSILATDAPPGASAPWWKETGQWSASLAGLALPELISDEQLRERVQFSFCDMTDIPDHFSDGFDFCWSACCFEHLGSLEAGMEFVLQSVEKTLKVGGVACHTSEFNVSSNAGTIDSGPTVLYRIQDVKKLVQKLESRGHQVLELPIEPGLSYIDHLVDSPPYDSDVHLKIRLASYVTTSFGIVVRRGR